jgi:periplasmic protein CpxP/Spy
MKATAASLLLTVALCGLAIAQEPPPQAEGPTYRVGPPPEGQTIVRGPNGQMVRVVGRGKWWKDSALMKRLGVSDEQIQKIEKIFQDHRLQLIDLHAALEKQEAILEPMVEADQPVEAQVVAQIDKIAQARANLEKSDALMLLAIRRVLTVDQWKKLRDTPDVATFHLGPEPRVPTPGPSPLPPPGMPPPRE